MFDNRCKGHYTIGTLTAGISLLAWPVGILMGWGPSPPGDSQRDRADAPAFDVRVDPRVELMSIIFRLAGNPEYNQPRVSGYAADVEAGFRPLADHPAVQLARRLRAEHGVSYDAVMSMAVHMDEALSPKERAPFDAASCRLDGRWPRDPAREFLKLAGDFAEKGQFQAFLAEHRQMYDTAAQRLRAVLESEAHLEWFERFFGARPTARFTVCLGLLNGGACYGPSFADAAGSEELFCVLGVWMTDEAGLPRFDRHVVPTVVHEFAHSYANRLADAAEEQLRPVGEALYRCVAKEMGRQAYGNWQTMMRESLVRACSARYVKTYGTADEFEQALKKEEGRAFLWIRGLVALLGEYEADRAAYPTLDAFMPKVVRYFDDYNASGLAQRYAQQETAAGAVQRQDPPAPAPKVVSISPAIGATGVDPKTAAIVITFDRAMQDQSWSVVGGGPNFPKVAAQPSYDAARKVLTLPVTLKPNWHYEFGLNSPSHAAFRSAEGVSLEPVWVTFDTGTGG